MDGISVELRLLFVLLGNLFVYDIFLLFLY